MKKFKIVSILFSFAVLFMSGCGEEGVGFYDDSEASVKTKKDSRIVGGDEVTSSTTYPWMVGLTYVSNKSTYVNQFCGGSLIAKNWVVTAAHCVDHRDKDEIKILAGTHILDIHNNGIDKSSRPSSGELVAVEEIVVHPKYNSYTSDFDIALIKLEKSLPYETLKIVASDDNLVGKDAQAIGWGLTDPSDVSSAPDVLRDVTLKIVSNSKCQQIYATKITNNMLCAGYYYQYKDTSSGDSGGPLVVDDEGVWKLVGLTSFGVQEGTSYGIYANVANLYDFIYEHVGNDNLDIKKLQTQTSTVVDQTPNPSSSHYYGSFAYSDLTNSWGYTWRYKSKSWAKWSSVLSCGHFDCRVVEVIYADECIAFASSSYGGGYISVKSDKESASQEALTGCNSSLNNSCKLEFSFCADGR